MSYRTAEVAKIYEDAYKQMVISKPEKRWEQAVRLAWRSPYWDKRNVAVCVPPGEVVFT